MALKEYEVTVNGMQTVMRLDDEDAKLYPEAKAVGKAETRKAASESRTKQAPAPANKSAES